MKPFVRKSKGICNSYDADQPLVYIHDATAYSKQHSALRIPSLTTKRSLVSGKQQLLTHQGILVHHHFRRHFYKVEQIFDTLCASLDDDQREADRKETCRCGNHGSHRSCSSCSPLRRGQSQSRNWHYGFPRICINVPVERFH